MVHQPDMVERVARILEPAAWAALGVADTRRRRERRTMSLLKARTIIEAMADPTETMVAAGVRQSTEFPVVPHGYMGEVQAVHPFTVRCCFRAMVQGALA